MKFVPVKPISIKERVSMVFVEKCQIDVLDGAFVLIDKTGIRKHIPIGGLGCVMMEPGVRISHAAVKLAATVGTLLIWVGEAGVRLYACGQPGGARSDKLLYQAKLALDEKARLKVVRKMFEIRFDQSAPKGRSIQQLRGIEGVRVRKYYKLLAKEYGVKWSGRKYDPKDWGRADPINKAISCATSCLYGLSEAAILAAGYAPAIGFLHTGKPLSFVYDIADLFKAETIIPLAFKIASQNPPQIDRAVRIACRNVFKDSKLLRRIIPTIEDVLLAGGLDVPQSPEDAVLPAIPLEKGLNDDGHRNE